MGLADPGRPTSERLFGVVVPDMELLRERRRSSTPATSSASRWKAWPPDCRRTSACSATTSGSSRCRGRRRRRSSGMRWSGAFASGSGRRHRMRRCRSSPPIARGWTSPHAAAVLVVIRGRLKAGARLFPDANLELDLGFDSMERVELLTELEQRIGLKVPQKAAAEIFTVRQLVGALSHLRRQARTTEPSTRESAVVGGAASRSAAGDRSGVERTAREAADRGAADALCARAILRACLFRVELIRAGEPSDERRLHHQPESPELSRSVHAVSDAAVSAFSRTCSSSAPSSISRRR